MCLIPLSFVLIACRRRWLPEVLLYKIMNLRPTSPKRTCRAAIVYTPLFIFEGIGSGRFLVRLNLDDSVHVANLPVQTQFESSDVVASSDRGGHFVISETICLRFYRDTDSVIGLSHKGNLDGFTAFAEFVVLCLAFLYDKSLTYFILFDF